MRRIPSPTGRLTLAAVLAATSLVIQLLGGVLGIGTYLSPILGGVCTLVVLRATDLRTATLHWLATGLLSLMLCTDKELALLYLALFGWYPLAKGRLDALGPGLLRRGVKLLLFNAIAVGLYALMLWVIFAGDAQSLGLGGTVLTLSLLVLGNLVFAVYDVMLGLMQLRLG